MWEHLDNDERRQLLSLLIEEGGLRIDREGRDIQVRLKLHLLPEIERTLFYRTFRGINRTGATGLQRLTQTQMVLLYHSGQGKTRRECAELLGCKVPSTYTLEKTIRKNLGGVSWAEAVEMSRERVQAHAAQLPLHHGGRGQAARAAQRDGGTQGEVPFLSPLLMEVFALFAQGATAVEAAEELKLPVVTVQGRRARILKAFGTKPMLEAVRHAKAIGVL